MQEELSSPLFKPPGFSTGGPQGIPEPLTSAGTSSSLTPLPLTAATLSAAAAYSSMENDSGDTEGALLPAFSTLLHTADTAVAQGHPSFSSFGPSSRSAPSAQ